MKTDQFQMLPKPKSEEEEAELYTALALVALKGKNHKFEFIRCWEHRKIVKVYKRALKTIIKKFKTLKQVNELLIKNGYGKLENVALCYQFDICVNYYTKELCTIKKMLTEYREYIFSGHILDTFLFRTWRPDELCYDHRGWPFNKEKLN